jgi:hypothetical protein
MGLFKKKEVKQAPSAPSLPELPRLPELPERGYEERQVHQLPSFPENSYGKKFSQDSIKDAVAGDGGEFKESYPEEDFRDEQRMQEPLRKPRTEEIEDEIDEEFPEKRPLPAKGKRPIARLHEEVEPIFVRLDRFEDGLKLFGDIKRKILDIEKTLAETKRIREREEEELTSWENQLKKMKDEIEKVNKDIFSKI